MKIYIYFYECKKHKIRLKSLEGDCCVFYSYGDVACIPIQKEQEKSGNGGYCCSI